jgi:hypothetical protein
MSIRCSLAGPLVSGCVRNLNVLLIHPFHEQCRPVVYILSESWWLPDAKCLLQTTSRECGVQFFREIAFIHADLRERSDGILKSLIPCGRLAAFLRVVQPTAFWHILRQLTNEEQRSILITFIQHDNAITTTKCKQSLCPSEVFMRMRPLLCINYQKGYSHRVLWLFYLWSASSVCLRRSILLGPKIGP